MKAWFCLFLLPLVSTTEISREENKAIKENCGAHFLGGKQRFKSFGGKLIRKGEYPWLGAVKVLERGQTSGACSAALISPRHLLTAAHCILNVPPNITENCRVPKNGYKLAAPPKDIRILVGSQCPKLKKCRNHSWLRVKEVHYHEEFNGCSINHDIGIYELSKDVPSWVATPICMPKEDQEIAHNLKAAGSGNTRPRSNNALKFQQVVNLTYHKTKEDLIIVRSRRGVGICGGDSGGPLFQSNDNSNITLLGMASLTGSCNSLHATGDTFYTDVRQYLDWVCERTGVCPTDDDDSEEPGPGGCDPEDPECGGCDPEDPECGGCDPEDPECGGCDPEDPDCISDWSEEHGPPEEDEHTREDLDYRFESYDN